MAAADYFVHRHYDTDVPEDHLDVWRPIPAGDKGAHPAIQINQADGATASVSYRPEDAVTIARAILAAAGIDPQDVAPVSLLASPAASASMEA